MRLERITVQAFRGYPSRADVVLSGNVVLLAGENGTGKTSLTEAFEWALFRQHRAEGTLEDPWRVPGFVVDPQRDAHRRAVVGHCLATRN